MNLKFAKDILNDLLNKYQKSTIFTKGSLSKKTNIYLKVQKGNKLEVFESHDAIKYGEEYIYQLKEIEKMGFVTLKFNVAKLDSVSLNLDKIEEVYSFLDKENPKKEIVKLRNYISNLSFNNYLDNFINDIKNRLDSNTIYKKYFENKDELEIILKSINGMINLDKEMMERDFSVNYLNDSKLFAQHKSKILSVIKKYDQNVDSDIENDELLASYNIVKNSTYALIKNGMSIKINNQIINLDDMSFEMSLSDKMIDALEILSCGKKKLITVENLTSFYMLNEDAVIVYLGGFHNHTKQLLLQKINLKYPNLDYYHFGDIDAGGFLIFKNLIDKTGIQFKPYRMDIKELINNKKHLKTLTPNDVKRLNTLLNDNAIPIFNDVIRYMLDNNVKLEQEILD